MNRLQITLLAMLGLALAVVLLVALRSRQPPVLPADADHAAFAGHAACLACHDAEGPLPRSRNHPIGNDCLRCHGLPK